MPERKVLLNIIATKRYCDNKCQLMGPKLHNGSPYCHVFGSLTWDNIRERNRGIRPLGCLNAERAITAGEEQSAMIRAILPLPKNVEDALCRLWKWAHTGADLCPGPLPDTFGEGARSGKAAVAKVLGPIMRKET